MHTRCIFMSKNVIEISHWSRYDFFPVLNFLRRTITENKLEFSSKVRNWYCYWFGFIVANIYERSTLPSTTREWSHISLTLHVFSGGKSGSKEKLRIENQGSSRRNIGFLHSLFRTSHLWKVGAKTWRCTKLPTRKLWKIRVKSESLPHFRVGGISRFWNFITRWLQRQTRIVAKDERTGPRGLNLLSSVPVDCA